MINKKSRSVLILITKLIDGSKKHVTNDVDCTVNLKDIGIGSNEFDAILQYLRSEKLITYTDSDSVIEDIALTEYGRMYPEIHKQEMFELALKSVFCPIIVTVLTNLLFLAIK